MVAWWIGKSHMDGNTYDMWVVNMLPYDINHDIIVTICYNMSWTMGYTSVKNLIYGGCNRLYPQWWSLGGTWDDGHIGLWRVFHGWSNTSKTWSIAPRVWAGKINNFWWPISEWLPSNTLSNICPKIQWLKAYFAIWGDTPFLDKAPNRWLCWSTVH